MTSGVSFSRPAPLVQVFWQVLAFTVVQQVLAVGLLTLEAWVATVVAMVDLAREVCSLGGGRAP